MNQSQKVFSTRALVGRAWVSTLVILSLTAVARAEGQQPSEMEDMRRELHQLRAQVQLLRAALSEVADLEFQKATALSRALKAVPALPPEASAAPAKSRDSDSNRAAPTQVTAAPMPPTPVVVVAPIAATSSAHSARRGSEASRKSADSSAAGAAGTVRGKVTVPKGEPVAYVYVENVSAPAVKDQHVSIEQVGKKFSPPWAVVQRGTVISFPNRDNIYHNVFSLSSGNSFDLGLYSAGESKSHAFNEPGEVEIYCNIHPQMIASALVVPNRLFAKVKPDGTFEIPGVPSGKRKVVAWAPSSRFATNWVDVEPGEVAQIQFTLEPKSAGHKNKSGQQYGSYE